MRAWFSGGSSGNDEEQGKEGSSLLSDWNSYAASKEAEEGTTTVFGFDLESAARSANDTVTGTFNVIMDLSIIQNMGSLTLHYLGGVYVVGLSLAVLWSGVQMVNLTHLYQSEDLVSKGVRDLPGNLQSATSSVPSGKAFIYFGLFLAAGVFFVFIAFTMFLPVMVLLPQKFAICFTLGCGFIIGSFFALRGPKNQLAHMSSKERLPFALGFIGSMVGTMYVSMVLHSYILSVLFSVVQVLALAYYAVSYFPGGSAGLKFLTSALTSSVSRCFGR
ncbi:hypothetical protein GOBAR_AA03654 [Gossypium barbadense]|uniref:Vesicle transport protein n=1 Tax=Gossypium barbadense TaxID=3634 RepID=A0A2P5YMW4_GOSBA|nr:hypothetical protein GOBAR_AA03654 [Gossypium barbadense]